jgi:hypothetical protein
MDKIKLSDTLNNSPSVELLKARNRESIILFFAEVFVQAAAVSSENIHYKLIDHLEAKNIEIDEDSESYKLFSTFEDRANIDVTLYPQNQKKHGYKWHLRI